MRFFGRRADQYKAEAQHEREQYIAAMPTCQEERERIRAGRIVKPRANPWIIGVEGGAYDDARKAGLGPYPGSCREVPRG